MWVLLFCTISILFSQLEAKPGCVKPGEKDIHCNFLVAHDTNSDKTDKNYNVTQNPTNLTCSDVMTQKQVDDKTVLLMAFFKGQRPRKSIYDVVPNLQPLMWFQVRCASEGVAEVKINNVWIEVTNGHCGHSEPFTPGNELRDSGAAAEPEKLLWSVKLVS